MKNIAPNPPTVNTLEEARAVIALMHGKLQEALWRVGQLEKQVYGSSSERQQGEGEFSVEQNLLALFGPAPEPSATEGLLVEEEVFASQEKKKEERVRRQPAFKVIESVTVRLEPQEKVCPHCGKDKCEIGLERSERFEYVPAKIVRQVLERPKLACSTCPQGGVVIAPLPPSVIEGGLPGPGLLAQVVGSKFEDHTPLERQRQQFERLGVYFPKSTLCDWVEKAATWLLPIVRLMKEKLLLGTYLQVDETPVKVLDPDVCGKSAKGWLWVLSQPKGDVVFEFYQGRSKEEAKQVIGAFQGFLQRDGFGVYGSLARDNQGLIPVGCWAHARRKFAEALEAREKLAIPVIEEIRKLYLIERVAREKNLGPPERHALRQEKSRPLLEALHPLLEATEGKVLPKSPLGKAIGYTLKEWGALKRFLDDGRLEIDNNLTENAIRPTAVGKKNWLFIGHPDAGWRSAVIYSIIVSCRRRGIEPWEYLKDAFTRLPAMKQCELHTLLPENWKPI